MDGLAFRSMVVQALQAAERVLAAERHVALATMSLGQRNELDAMTSTVDALIHALRPLLGDQGHRLLALGGSPRPSLAAPTTWWACLDHALTTLDHEAQRLAAVACGQADQSPVRVLSRALCRLFRDHHARLQDERLVEDH